MGKNIQAVALVIPVARVSVKLAFENPAPAAASDVYSARFLKDLRIEARPKLRNPTSDAGTGKYFISSQRQFHAQSAADLASRACAFFEPTRP